MIDTEEPVALIADSGFFIGRPVLMLKIIGNEFGHEDELIKPLKEAKENVLYITGDEPLKYQRELIYVLTQLRKQFKIVVVTSGGVMPDSLLRKLVDEWIIKIPVESEALVSDALFTFSQMANASFIFRTDQSADQIDSIISEFSIKPGNVWLMPSITSFLKAEETIKTANDMVVEKGWNLAFPLWNIEKEETASDNVRFDA